MTVVERAIVAHRQRVALTNAVLRDVEFFGASGLGAPPEALPRSVIAVTQLRPTRVVVPFDVTETVEVAIGDGPDDYPNRFERVVNEIVRLFDESADIGNAYARIHRCSFLAGATFTPTSTLRKAVIKWSVFASWEVVA